MSQRHKALPSDDFGPLLPGPAFGCQTHVMKVLFGLDCFEHLETCPKCGCECTFQTNNRVKKLKDGSEKQYPEVSLRCTSRKCQARAHFIDNTIWAIVKDRILFVFVVNAFLNRASTQSVVNDTGCKQSTAEKYMRIIKNALFLENEEEKKYMKLGGKGETVQADESCVFKRKNGVGRILELTRHGWLFGVVEDKIDGRLYIQMIRHKDADTLQGIIKEHVEKETTIFTDCWPSYNGLNGVNGYKHYNVNHSEHFVEQKPLQMSQAEERAAIQIVVNDFEDAGDDAFEDEGVVEQPMVSVNTQKIERSWREVKRELTNQHISVLRRNVGVAIYRYNHLNVRIPLVERREMVIRAVAKNQMRLRELMRQRFPVYEDEELL